MHDNKEYLPEVKIPGDGDCLLVSMTVSLIAAFLSEEFNQAIEEGRFDGLLGKLNEHYLSKNPEDFPENLPLPMETLEHKKEIFKTFLETYSNFKVDDPCIKNAIKKGHLGYLLFKLCGNQLKNEDDVASRTFILNEALSDEYNGIHNPKDPLFPPIAILTGIFRQELTEGIKDPEKYFYDEKIKYDEEIKEIKGRFGEQGVIPTERLPAAFGKYEEKRKEGQGCLHKDALTLLSRREENTFYHIKAITDFFETQFNNQLSKNLFLKEAEKEYFESCIDAFRNDLYREDDNFIKWVDELFDSRPSAPQKEKEQAYWRWRIKGKNHEEALKGILDFTVDDDLTEWIHFDPKDAESRFIQELEELIRIKFFQDYWKQEGKKHYLDAIATPKHWLSSFPDLQVLSKKYGFYIVCVVCVETDSDDLSEEKVNNWPVLTWKFEENHYNSMPNQSGYGEFLKLKKKHPSQTTDKKKGSHKGSKKEPLKHSLNLKPEIKKIEKPKIEPNDRVDALKNPNVVDGEKDVPKLSLKEPEEVNKDKEPGKVNKDKEPGKVNKDKEPEEVNKDKEPEEVPNEVNKPVSEEKLKLQEKARQLLGQQRTAIEDIRVNTKSIDKAKKVAYWIAVACLVFLIIFLCIEAASFLPSFFALMIFLLVPGGGFGALYLIGPLALFLHLDKENQNLLAENSRQKDTLKIATYWMSVVCLILLTVTVGIAFFFIFFELPMLIFVICVSLFGLMGGSILFAHLNSDKKRYFDEKKVLTVNQEKNRIKDNFLFDKVHSNEFPSKSDLENHFYEIAKVLVEEVFKEKGVDLLSEPLAAYLFRLRLGSTEVERKKINTITSREEAYKILERPPQNEWVHELIRSIVPNEKQVLSEKLIRHLTDMLNYTLQFPVPMKDKPVTRELVISYLSAILDNQREILPFIFQMLNNPFSRGQLINFLLDEREPEGWGTQFGIGKDFLEFRGECLRLLCTSPEVCDDPLFKRISERLRLTPKLFTEKELYNFTFNVLKTCDDQQDDQAFLFKILSVQIQAFDEKKRVSVVTTILGAYEDYCLTHLEAYNPFEFFESLNIEIQEEKTVLDECKKTPIGQLYCAAKDQPPEEISVDELIRQYEKLPELFKAVQQELLALKSSESMPPNEAQEKKLNLWYKLLSNELIRQYEKAPELFETFLQKLLALESKDAQEKKLNLLHKLLSGLKQGQFLEIQFLLLKSILTLLNQAPDLFDPEYVSRLGSLIAHWSKNPVESTRSKVKKLYDEVISLSKKLKPEQFAETLLKIRAAYAQFLYPLVKDAPKREKLLTAKEMPDDKKSFIPLIQGAFESFPDKKSCLDAVRLLLEYYRNNGEVLLLAGPYLSELNQYPVEYPRLFVMFNMFLNDYYFELSPNEKLAIFELIKGYLQECQAKLIDANSLRDKMRDLLLEKMPVGEREQSEKFLYFFERALYDLGGLGLEAQGLSSNLQSFTKKIKDFDLELDAFVLAAKECLELCDESELFVFWMIFLNVLKAGNLRFNAMVQIQEKIENFKCSRQVKSKMLGSLHEAWALWDSEFGEREKAIDEMKSNWAEVKEILLKLNGELLKDAQDAQLKERVCETLFDGVEKVSGKELAGRLKAKNIVDEFGDIDDLELKNINIGFNKADLKELKEQIQQENIKILIKEKEYFIELNQYLVRLLDNPIIERLLNNPIIERDIDLKNSVRDLLHACNRCLTGENPPFDLIKNFYNDYRLDQDGNIFNLINSRMEELLKEPQWHLPTARERKWLKDDCYGFLNEHFKVIDTFKNKMIQCRNQLDAGRKSLNESLTYLEPMDETRFYLEEFLKKLEHEMQNIGLAIRAELIKIQNLTIQPIFSEVLDYGLREEICDYLKTYQKNMDDLINHYLEDTLNNTPKKPASEFFIRCERLDLFLKKIKSKIHFYLMEDDESYINFEKFKPISIVGIMDLWEDFFSGKKHNPAEFERLCHIVQLGNPLENDSEYLDEVLFDWFKYFLRKLNSEKVSIEQEVAIHRCVREYAEKQHWPKFLQEELNYFLKMPRKSRAKVRVEFEFPGKEKLFAFLERNYPKESTYFHFRARSLFVSDKGAMDINAIAEQIESMIFTGSEGFFFSPALEKAEAGLLNRFLEMTFDWVKDIETGGKKENLANDSGVDTMKIIYKVVKQLVGQNKKYSLDALDKAYRNLGFNVETFELNPREMSIRMEEKLF